MSAELLKLFRRNFPFAVIDDNSAKSILGNECNKILTERNDCGEIIGASVINGSTILMLCVDKKYRRQGIGTRLLELSEEIIKKDGYDEITVGVGDDYLTPGVPTSRRYYPAVNEELSDDIGTEAGDFFEKRGYIHSRDCNIFDMRFPLRRFNIEEHSVGDTIDGIYYRWAEISDLDRICSCTDDALPEFTRWYRDENLYDKNGSGKVLIAADGNIAAGVLIVSSGNEGVGTVGCTSVRHSYRGRRIASNMVILGTKYLRDIGMKEAFLSYTYSGLDKLYGSAGYRISVFYMRAKKNLSDNNI